MDVKTEPLDLYEASRTDEEATVKQDILQRDYNLFDIKQENVDIKDETFKTEANFDQADKLSSGSATVHTKHLEDHVKTHTGKKAFACSVCDYRAAQKSTLENHMKTHTGVKPFGCGVCDYRAARRATLKTHIKGHMAEKPFVCGVCSYRTAWKESLKKHIKTHTGDKPFACSLCEYRATQKSNLAHHMKIPA